MGVSAAREESFGKWKAAGFSRDRLRTSLSGKGHEGIAERLFDTEPCGSGQDIAPGAGPFFSVGVIGRVLDQRAPKINFQRQVTVGNTRIHRGVTAASGIQIVVPAVADEADTWNTNAGGQREQGHLIGAD